MPGEAAGETLDEWTQRAKDWDERAAAELAEWTGRGRGDYSSDEEEEDDVEDASESDEQEETHVQEGALAQARAAAEARLRALQEEVMRRSLAARRRSAAARPQRPQLFPRRAAVYGDDERVLICAEKQDGGQTFFRIGMQTGLDKLQRAFCLREGVLSDSLRWTYTALA